MGLDKFSTFVCLAVGDEMLPRHSVLSYVESLRRERPHYGLPAARKALRADSNGTAVGNGGEEPRARPADVVPGQPHGADDGCGDH